MPPNFDVPAYGLSRFAVVTDRSKLSSANKPNFSGSPGDAVIVDVAADWGNGLGPVQEVYWWFGSDSTWKRASIQ
jgi:hypothetical protein